MVAKADALVDELSSALASAPAFSELDSSDTVELRIRYHKNPPRDMEGVAVSFHYGPLELTEKIVDAVEPRVDKRKFRVSTDKPKYRQGKSWLIGTVTVNGDAEIVEYNINSEYLKPTET